ncbi:unnamed protein product [Leuciscus chuanchicus]
MSFAEKTKGNFLCIDEAFGSRDLQTSTSALIEQSALERPSRLRRDPQFPDITSTSAVYRITLSICQRH